MWVVRNMRQTKDHDFNTDEYSEAHVRIFVFGADAALF